MRKWSLLGSALALAACGTAEQSPVATEAEAGESRLSGWALDSEGTAVKLILAGDSSAPQIRLICSGEGEFLVNVPAFRPVGSEERMTFGQGTTVEVFVADPSGDKDRGGVTGAGPVPTNLEALVSGRVAANYGSQDSGPHPAPPSNLVKGFVSACGAPEPARQQQPGEAADRGGQKVSACLVQDGRRIPAMGLHAVGTEPFWAANVEGRCVTYSTPEDQDGTRVWTQFSGSSESGTWRGALGGQSFVMRTRPEQGCSDGMSDIRYPIEVTLTVMGEERRGCARRR